MKFQFASIALVVAAMFAISEEPSRPFNGSDLSGWKFRDKNKSISPNPHLRSFQSPCDTAIASSGVTYNSVCSVWRCSATFFASLASL